MRSMRNQYGKSLGTKVFYASLNKNTIRGVEESTYRRSLISLIETCLREEDRLIKVKPGDRFEGTHFSMKGGEFTGATKSYVTPGGTRKLIFVDPKTEKPLGRPKGKVK